MTVNTTGLPQRRTVVGLLVAVLMAPAWNVAAAQQAEPGDHVRITSCVPVERGPTRREARAGRLVSLDSAAAVVRRDSLRVDTMPVSRILAIHVNRGVRESSDGAMAGAFLGFGAGIAMAQLLGAVQRSGGDGSDDAVARVFMAVAFGGTGLVLGLLFGGLSGGPQWALAAVPAGTGSGC